MEVYPLLVTDQIEQDCQSLICFMQIALTLSGLNLPSIIEVAPPTAPPRYTCLLGTHLAPFFCIDHLIG